MKKISQQLKATYQMLGMAVLTVFSINSVKADCIYEDNLKGKEHEVGVMLTWATLSESNNSMFVVERLEENGRDFSQIGTVKGNLNSKTKKTYMFLDPASSRANKVTYRLKQVDSDGGSTLSDPFTLVRKVQNLIAVMQMSSESTSKMFNFTVDAVFTGDITLVVRNGADLIVEQRQACVKEGINNFSVDLTDKPVGTYKISIRRGTEEERMVVRKTLSEEERRTNMASSQNPTGKN
jgi:hypothetical protein